MRDVYLHCRMIDLAPLNMYTKAGYNIVKTDSIRVLLMLQRRKHLMCKKLAVLKNPSELDISGSDTELSSQLDMLKSWRMLLRYIRHCLDWTQFFTQLPCMSIAFVYHLLRSFTFSSISWTSLFSSFFCFLLLYLNYCPLHYPYSRFGFWFRSFRV